MNWEQRRMLERAGILRRRTPNHLLTEGDDEGGDDLFGDDAGGDDAGGDDLFGDDAGGGDDMGGDAGGEEGAEEEGVERVPPEELSAEDIEKFGSPRFLDVELKIKNMFNDAMTSAGAASQNMEVYPGQAIEDEPTPAKDDEPEEDETEEEEDDEKNESFYRYGNRRDKWLINEARRLLMEAEDEGSPADVFDMERFCTELANYMDTIHNTEDIEAGIFNGARQMILNNFGPDTEKEFIDMLSAVTDGNYSFLQTGFEGDAETPIAVGAGEGGGGV